MCSVLLCGVSLCVCVCVKLPSQRISRVGPSFAHQLVVARFATGKCRASLSHCAGCWRLPRQLAKPFRPPACIIAPAAGLLPKSCRQNETKARRRWRRLWAAWVELNTWLRALQRPNVSSCFERLYPRVPLQGGRVALPWHSPALRNTRAVLKHAAKVVLSFFCFSDASSWFERLHTPARRRGGSIGWPLICPAQHLSRSQTSCPSCSERVQPLCRCKAVESHSLGIVLRNT